MPGRTAGIQDFVVEKKIIIKLQNQKNTAEHKRGLAVALWGEGIDLKKINLQPPSLLYYDLYLNISHVMEEGTAVIFIFPFSHFNGSQKKRLNKSTRMITVPLCLSNGDSI